MHLLFRDRCLPWRHEWDAMTAGSYQPMDWWVTCVIKRCRKCPKTVVN